MAHENELDSHGFKISTKKKKKEVRLKKENSIFQNFHENFRGISRKSCKRRLDSQSVSSALCSSIDNLVMIIIY